MVDIKTVTVIGANGTMGYNVSGIFASFGNVKVNMLCRSIDAAEKAKVKAARSVKAEAIEKNLIPRSYDDLEECISASDLIFESIAEDINLKKSIYEKISKYIKPNAIIASGTSGLSINDLSQCFELPIRSNFLGIHLYNPPYNMTLCEIIPSVYTERNLIEKIKPYFQSVLKRKVVEVEDKPAFMGNRIGFQFINEVMQYAQIYKDKGGIDYMDSILGQFTGRSMSPLITSDFVGLDIHKAIVDNIYENVDDYARDTFLMPVFALKLISENKLGRKTNGGLYKSIVKDDGTKEIAVYDISSDQYRKVMDYNFPFKIQMIHYLKTGDYSKAFDQLINDTSLEAEICIQFMIKYVIYSLTITKSIGENIYSADDVMAAGFNWVPPLAVIDALGGAEIFETLTMNKMPKEFLSKTNISEILRDAPKSRYDYRSYFKAR